MGQSTDAILFFGYCWPDEEGDDPWNIGVDWEDADEEDDDADDRYARLLGLEAVPYDGDIPELYRAYLDRRSNLLAHEPCTVGTHCSCDCPMAYVAVKESVVKAHRGHPLVIFGQFVQPHWAEQLETFADIMKIPKQTPQWWLVSNWC